MNKKCLKCGANIGHLHQNSKYCLSCRKKPVNRTIIYREDTIKMKRSEFYKLRKQATLYKALELASTLHLAVCFKGDNWLVRYNKLNVDLLDWYKEKIK
jgi:hypothetical protein